MKARTKVWCYKYFKFKYIWTNWNY